MSYKLLTYRDATGTNRAGILVNEQVHDVATMTGNPTYVSVLEILNNWGSVASTLKKCAQDIVSKNISGKPLGTVELDAPVLYPGAIYCAGANYVDHIQEMMRAMKMSSDIDPYNIVGREPWHFLKTSRGSVVGTGAMIAKPTHTQKLDWEAELVAVIGKTAKNISVEEALQYVAGYTVTNDLSARDLVKRDYVPESSPFRWDWLGQKCFDGALPVGPWITPAEDIPDPHNLAIKLWVNDRLMQDSNTSKLIFNVAQQIAFLSTKITLHPGDFVATGTPAGVGAARGEFLNVGDEVRVFVENIGELTHKII